MTDLFDDQMHRAFGRLNRELEFVTDYEFLFGIGNAPYPTLTPHCWCDNREPNYCEMGIKPGSNWADVQCSNCKGWFVQPLDDMPQKEREELLSIGNDSQGDEE